MPASGADVRAAVPVDAGEYEVEYRFRRYDNGEARHIVARGRVAMGSDGAPVRHAGVVIDATDSRRAERQLEESRARYQLLFDSSSDISAGIASFRRTRRPASTR